MPSTPPSTADRNAAQPLPGGNRDAIATAAAEQFAALGFERTTIRSVAAQAGVDPALVMHYFGSKQGLLAATLTIPAGVGAALRDALAGPAEEAGRGLAVFLSHLLTDPYRSERVEALLRTAVSEPAALDVLRRFLEEPLGQAVTCVAETDGALRANLIGALLIGVAFAREVTHLEPIASADEPALAALLAPVLQHLLTADLTATTLLTSPDNRLDMT